ncbi:hybrid sensor histidine kinase/response regulator (plasmid) [Azospirillum humicireducens]|uniref:histidine kinase n=1 Tax=Azospirillum humicireducens TaxID=1226968 RepID=A0A2R4VS26_9PROT|nr:response regulator [Azospirillum humicireducens]AWB07253.1 hybrid sensor histidine kinase/response regulator [Azospirillum humicireducens]
MGAGIIIALAHGVGLLALVLLAYRYVLRRFGARRLPFALLSGLLFGVAAAVSMLDAYPLEGGVLIDLRNVMIGLAGLFGGWPAAMVAAAAAGGVRLWLGGMGSLTGLAGILLTALAAPLLARPLERRAAGNRGEGKGKGQGKGKGAYGFGLLALFGLAITPLTLLAFMLLPDPRLALRVLEETALPLTAFTALGIGLLGTMLAREHRRVDDENALAESAALFRAVFDSSADSLAIVRVGENGGFTLHSANAAALRAMGDRAADAAGKPLDSLLPPDLAAKAMADLQSCIDAGAPTRFEAQHTHQGVTRWWEVSQVPIRDCSGAIVMLSVGARDITRRHEAERAIRASEARYRLLARGVTDIIGRIGLDGVRNFCSEATRDSLGCAPIDLIGRPLVERVHPDDRAALSAGLAQLTPARPTLNTTYRLRHADGRWVWIEAAVRLVTDDWGAPQDYVSVERDVTARKIMEAELQDARQAAESASRSKTEFLASLSHELRTPMNAVIGFADLIARESEGPVGNAHYRDFAVNIRDSGQHLLELINEILDHVRAEAGQLVLEDEPVDLDAAATFAIRLLTPRAARAGIALSATVDPAARFLRGDERRLRQILLNLLSNAVKYTPSGGAVSLAAGPAPDGGLLLEVRDTGIGIPEQDLGRVLQAYTRVESPANRQTEGAGLGLPLTRRLVELHGGTMTLSSRVGQGTTVTLHFPPDRLADESGGSVRPPSDRPGLSILMVEDDHNILENGCALLRSWGHRVIGASGAGEALPVLQGPEPLDLLFSDIVMPPGMNGAELAREARRLRPDLPVLLASGFAAHAVVADDVALGGYDLIAKPYDPLELRDRLARLHPLVPSPPPAPPLAPPQPSAPPPPPIAETVPEAAPEAMPEPAAEPPAEPSIPLAALPSAATPGPAASAPGSLRILVAEDVEMNRLLAVTLLKQAGHSVSAVEDGAQAVAAAAAADGREPFDAILMDVNMPVMDGLEATRAIRAMPGPAGRVAIVALTANTFPDDIARCYEAGMDCHVPKPIDRVLLLTEIARCVASRRAVEAMGGGG